MRSLIRFPRLLFWPSVLIVFVLAASAWAQETWTPLGLSGNGIMCVAVAPGNSNLLVAGGTNLYVSSNGGSTWNTVTAPAAVWSVAFGSNQNVAFAGCWGPGVFKSTDGGATWIQRNSGLTNTVVKSICVSPIDDNTVYAAVESGLFKSTNGATSWSSIYGGVNASAVAVAPTNANTVYLGTWGAGVLKSTDAGSTWNPLTVGTVPTGATCNSIAVDPANEGVVYAVFQGNGAWASLDGGTNWTQLSPSFEGFCAATDKLRPGFVYGLGGWGQPDRSGCYGATGWKAMSSSWSGSWFARGIGVDPNDPSKVYGCSNSPMGGLFQWIADVAAPNAPTNLSASSSGTGINLTWTASATSDCTGYWVYRTTTSGVYPLTPYAEVIGRTTTTFADVNANGGTRYYYKLAAIDNAQNHSTLTSEVNALVASTYDLDVTYIERTPRDTYRYNVQYTSSGVPYLQPGSESQKRWPAFGEVVTFVAHFINKGTALTPVANYRWKVNGVQVATGTASGLAHGEEGTASLNWSWNVNGLDTDHSDQTVVFEINYDNAFSESFTQNNSLTDYIEALTLQVVLEPALYDALNGRVNLTGTYSAEDWLQAQMKATNSNFARSTYATLAPSGSKERMRIDKIIVAGSQPPDDLTYDGRWMISGGANYASTFALGVDGGLVHEWMHQVGLIDDYQLNIESDSNLVLTPDGLLNGTDFSWSRAGLMGGGDISPHTSGSSSTMPEYLASWDVGGQNSTCGYRRGYYGEYLFDIPASNHVVVKDAAGNAAPNVTVKIFQRNNGPIPNSPIITGVTDATGTMLLPNRAVVQSFTTATGHIEHDNPFGTVNVVGGNANLLVEMSRPGGDFDYAWMDITKFNLAYWSGNADSWTYTINSRLSTGAVPRITALNGTVQTLSGQPTKVALTWPAVSGATSYSVYRASRYLNQAADPTHQYENWVYRPIATGVTATSYTDSTISENSRYAVAAVNASSKVGPLSNRFFAPRLIQPWSVGILANNNRAVLDPQNGHALIWQGPDGVYLANFGIVHFHLEYSKFMAVDTRTGHLIFSHPADEYSSNHSIKVNDMNASLATGLFEIGTTGSAAGQFSNPTGVAVDTESRIYGMDSGNNRIQVFTSTGTFICQFGSLGSGNGQFKTAQGIAVDSRHRIYVCDQGNSRVQILQFNTGTNTISYLGTLQGRTLASPVAVTIGPADNVFVTDCSASRNSVEAFSSYGNFMHTYTQANGVYTGNLNYPTGLAVDQTGALVVCDTNNKRVVTLSVAQPASAAAARTLTDSLAVQLQGKTVTAKFSGYFYVQDATGVPGIRVVSGTTVAVGQLVDVYGTMRTTNGEREILAATATAHATSPAPPAPLGMNMRTTGGGPEDPVPGINGAYGLNNVGLLAKVFGITSARNTTNQEFYLDDGSGFTMRVYAPGLTLPADGSHVAVTGIIGAEISASKVVRVLRARSILGY